MYVAYLSETFFPMLEAMIVVNEYDVAMCSSLSVGLVTSMQTRTSRLSVRTNRRNPEKGLNSHRIQPFPFW